MLVSERSRDIGNFLVGRLLPFRKKRQVGPFTFIDHMGPTTIKAPHYMDVDQHPHIGLSTLTYLLESQIEHRDSTGAQAKEDWKNKHFPKVPGDDTYIPLP